MPVLIVDKKDGFDPLRLCFTPPPRKLKCGELTLELVLILDHFLGHFRPHF